MSLAADDYDLLGVPKSSTLGQVKMAYREKARVLHPDHGGDATQFGELAKAYVRIRAKLEKDGDPCDGCNGKRTVTTRSKNGMHSMTKPCPKCRERKKK